MEPVRLNILYLITSSFGGYQVTHHEAWGWYPPKPKAEGDTTPQAETYVHAVVLNSNSTEKLYLKLKQINNTIRQSTIKYILLLLPLNNHSSSPYSEKKNYLIQEHRWHMKIQIKIMAGLGDWANFVFWGNFFKKFQASSTGYLWPNVLT